MILQDTVSAQKLIRLGKNGSKHKVSKTIAAEEYT